MRNILFVSSQCDANNFFLEKADHVTERRGQAQPEATYTLHRLLLRSRDWGLGALPELSRIAAPSFDMSSSQVLAYFHQLNFFLSLEHEQGLATFFHYLYNLGELAEEPELEYFRDSKCKGTNMKDTSLYKL